MSRTGASSSGWAGRVALGVGLIALATVAWSWLRPASVLERGQIAYRRGDWATATSLAEGHLAKRPNDPEALRLLARSAARLGRDDVAHEAFGRLDGRDAEAEDLYLLGLALRRRGDPQSQLILEQALRIGPNHPETLFLLAQDRLERRWYLAAEGLARRLMAQQDWGPRGAWALGLILMRQSAPSEAAEALERAMATGRGPYTLPEPPTTARKRLARAWLHAGQPELARRSLEIVLRQGPDREASWLLSRAWLQERNWERAEAALADAGGLDESPLVFEPSPFVGSAACAPCHADKAAAFRSSRHATTFQGLNALAALELPDGAIIDPDDPDVSHRLSTDGMRIRIETSIGDRTWTALAEAALGSGHRALTLIARDETGQAWEYRLTHYAEAGWDRTIHHPSRPATHRDFLGKRLSNDQVPDCVRCHVTDVRSAMDQAGPLGRERGIGCERCHGPGEHHLRAVGIDFSELAIARPSLAVGPGRSSHCVECHDAPAGATPSSRDFVRFQAPNLAMSRCFSGSGGRLDCVTCHDPHHDAETSPAHYEATCLSCHGPSQRQVPPWPSCPVNPTTGCLVCHMPSVPESLPHTAYTDHFIRKHGRPGHRPSLIIETK